MRVLQIGTNHINTTYSQAIPLDIKAGNVPSHSITLRKFNKHWSLNIDGLPFMLFLHLIAKNYCVNIIGDEGIFTEYEWPYFENITTLSGTVYQTK